MGSGHNKLWTGHKAPYDELVDYRHLGCSPADDETATCLVGHGSQMPGRISQDIYTVEDVVFCPVFASGSARMNVKK